MGLGSLKKSLVALVGLPSRWSQVKWLHSRSRASEGGNPQPCSRPTSACRRCRVGCGNRPGPGQSSATAATAQRKTRFCTPVGLRFFIAVGHFDFAERTTVISSLPSVRSLSASRLGTANRRGSMLRGGTEEERDATGPRGWRRPGFVVETSVLKWFGQD